MNKTCFVAAIIVVLFVQSSAFSQTQELPKFEVAAEFTTLERDDFSGQRTEPGFGGRFTYNLNRVFSLEAAGYFFPKDCFDCVNNGRVTEVLGGVKVSKRFESWGIFAKARPGVVSFSEGNFNVFPANLIGSFPFQVEISRVNSFAADIGGGIEFYPSKRIVTRFDAGDTIIHFNRRVNNAVVFDSSTGGFNVFPFVRRARTTHNFQFMTSVGFRF